MTRTNSDRRKFLAASGTALTIAVAGCLGGDDDDDENGEDLPDDVRDYLEENDANGDWTLADHTGDDAVTIDNGVEEEAGEYEFDPVVVQISEGTEVTWAWVGEAPHTVTHEEGEFESEELSGSGETFEYTFDEAGTYKYYCEPHRGVGQVGVVIVE